MGTRHGSWLLPTLLLAANVLAGPPPAAAREIEQLIAGLGASGCDFERNGRWYPPGKAREHLHRKYEWLRERDKVATAEQFIELAGARSSVSGRAYRVRCPGRPVASSEQWLTGRLREIRAGGAHAESAR